MDPVMVWCLVCGVCGINNQLNDMNRQLRKLRKITGNQRPDSPEMIPLSDVVVYQSPV